MPIRSTTSAKGSRSTIAWCPETSFGVLPPASGWYFRTLNSEGFGENIETLTGEDIRPDRATPSVRGGNISTSGTLTHDFDLVSTLPWLRHLLGSAALSAGTVTPSALAVQEYKRGDYFTALSKTWLVLRGGTLAATVVAADLTNFTATGTVAELPAAIGSPIRVECVGTSAGLNLYSYTASGASGLPAGGLAIEKAILGAEDPLYVQFVGCRLDSLELSIPQSALCKASWSLVGTRADAPISASATATITLSANPSDNDTVVIAGTTYTFKTTLGATSGQVLIGADVTATSVNLVAAIMLHTGAGTKYAAATPVHASVYATSAVGVTTLTAKLGGTEGNSLTLTKVGTNIAVSGATLTGGTSGKRSGTPSTLTRQPVTGLQAFIDVGDAAYVGKTDNTMQWRDASISIGNGIDQQAYVIGDRYRFDVPEGTRTISGRLSCYYTERTTYDWFKNEIEVPIAISFAYGGEFLRIELPETKLTGDGQPKIAGPGLMMQDFTFTAFLDSGDNVISGAVDIRVYAVNKASTLPS